MSASAPSCTTGVSAAANVRRASCASAATRRIAPANRSPARRSDFSFGFHRSVMTYAVKEIFYTLQGEGANAGRPAVFCRFAGCNLWSGREADRANAVCQFCDTDFVGTDGDGGGKFESAEELAAAVAAKWPKSDAGKRFVICTGGEPLLQIDAALIDALHKQNFLIAIETNGTIAVPEGIDWVCVSPKANAELVVTRGDELKVVYPQQTDPR